MAAVNPPPHIKLPKKLAQDPELRAYFQNRDFVQFQLWQRSGGGADLVEDAIGCSSSDENRVAFLTGQALILESRIADLEDQNATLAQRSGEFICVTKTANYQAVDYNFVNAKSGATISLPEYPRENSEVIIRNGDGSNIKLDGAGKNINGSRVGVITQKQTAIFFHYFIDSDEWLAR